MLTPVFYLVFPNYIFTYNGNQYVRVTPYAHFNYAAYPDVYKFSDDSQIGQVAASDGDSSNYRFFEIQPIKWIVLNYNKGFDESSNIEDGLTVGTMKRYELLTNDVLMSGIAPDNILWEDNSINTYMNKQMFNEIFSFSEQHLIKQSIIYNNTDNTNNSINTTGSNSNYLASGSNSSTQNMYLLSYYEVTNTSGPYAGSNKIFRSNSDRIETGTDYAKAHYLWINQDNKNVCWWVRSTNGTTNYFIGTSGGSGENNAINTPLIGTRPAMQVGQECLF